MQKYFTLLPDSKEINSMSSTRQCAEIHFIVLSLFNTLWLENDINSMTDKNCSTAACIYCGKGSIGISRMDHDICLCHLCVIMRHGLRDM